MDSVTSLFSLLSNNSSENKQNKSEEITTDLNVIIDLTLKTLDSITDKKTYQATKLCGVSFTSKEKYDAAVTVCDQLTEYINKFYKNVWINKNNTINNHNFERQTFTTGFNEPPLEEINSLLNLLLKSVEKLYKKHSDIKTNNEDDKLLKNLIIHPLSADLEDCNINSINKQLKYVLESSVGNNVLRTCRPLFEQYSLLVQFFITQQTMVYRVLSKINYLLSTLFTDLATNVSSLKIIVNKYIFL